MTIRSYQYQVQALVTPGTGGEVTASVAQSLALSDGVEFLLNTELLSATETLSLFDQAVFLLLPGGVSTVIQDLSLSDSVQAFGFETVTDVLSLSDVATFDFADFPVSSRNDLDLTQQVEVGFLVRNLTATDTLAFTQLLGLSRDFAVASTLGVTDYASFTGVSSDLSLTDAAEWGYGYDAENTLTITQSLGVIQGLNKGLSHNLNVGQAVAYYMESRCNRVKFNSFHGSGGVEPKEKHLTYNGKLTLRSLDTGQLLELKNPETDDKRRLAFSRVNRKFFDGTVDIFSDPSWVTEETQIYTLTGLKREKLDTLFQFLLDNLGREILLRDWKGVTWIVIITNPGEVYTEDREGYWTVDFQVEGQAIMGEYVLDNPSLSDPISRSGSEWLRPGIADLSVSDQLRLNRGYPVGPLTALSLSDSSTFTIETP